jgi:hypothetical protein
MRMHRAVLVLLPLLATGSPAEDPPRPARCCFTNPGYSGTCEVTPAKDESCAKILDYLNNPNSLGKSYCENTNLRGGWKSAPCPKKSPSPKP